MNEPPNDLPSLDDALRESVGGARRRTLTGVLLVLAALGGLLYWYSRRFSRPRRDREAAEAPATRASVAAELERSRAFVTEREAAFLAAVRGTDVATLVPRASECSVHLPAPRTERDGNNPLGQAIFGPSFPLHRVGSDAEVRAIGSSHSWRAFASAAREIDAALPSANPAMLQTLFRQARSAGTFNAEVVFVTDAYEPPRVTSLMTFASGSVRGRAFMFHPAGRRFVCAATVEAHNSEGLQFGSQDQSRIDAQLSADLDLHLWRRISFEMRALAR